mmetsp:Transcript_8576/g.17361  ORF Transcript_8576/g.17361 Transcript_8576/m.17361 type:complete len:166 (+) Transcript_8576:95-592(+)
MTIRKGSIGFVFGLYGLSLESKGLTRCNGRLGVSVSEVMVQGRPRRAGVGCLASSEGADRKMKLEPEETVFEFRPSWTEVVIPAVSILTVIGVIPFMASLARQFWVKYTFTTRRIAVEGGFQGKDRVEIVYRDIEDIKYVRRFGGTCADVVFFLRDGARLEMRVR